jgi:hypothetical protein
MNEAQVITIIISVAAFGVAAYGILERRLAARRSERLRLTTIVENLAKVRLELIEMASKGQTIGDVVEAVNARLEVLSQQALSLIVQEHSLTITSTECREVAVGLEQAGYIEDAEFIWDMALERAAKEGDTQVLFASRGYAFFLFRTQREGEARKVLEEALAKHSTNTESSGLVHAYTLKIWIVYEIQTEGPEAKLVPQLTQQLAKLDSLFATPRGKAMFKDVAESGNVIIRIEKPELNAGPPPE